MNLREANVMREQMADLRAKLASLENRLALVEDAAQQVAALRANALKIADDRLFHVEQIKRGPGRPRKNANDR